MFKLDDSEVYKEFIGKEYTESSVEEYIRGRGKYVRRLRIDGSWTEDLRYNRVNVWVDFNNIIKRVENW